MAIPRNLANIAPSVAGNSDGVTGITFAATQSASADANTLDDYEEGTWTPQFFAGGSRFDQGIFDGGSYTKIGNLVTLMVKCRLNNITAATGHLSIRNLPFTANSSRGGVDFFIGKVETQSAKIHQGRINNNQAEIFFYQAESAGNPIATITNADSYAYAGYGFCVSYRV